MTAPHWAREIVPVALFFLAGGGKVLTVPPRETLPRWQRYAIVVTVLLALVVW